MLYRFIIVSDEVDEFRRDIIIDSDATFFELHETLLDSVKYAKDQITSFFICNEDWEKGTEITLIDMGSGFDEDIYVMENTRLSYLLDEEKQKLVYVFEPLTERCFFVELREIITGETQDKAQVTKSIGNPPAQVTKPDELDLMAAKVTSATEFEDDDLYGEFSDEDFDEEDLANFSEDNPYDY